jgi:hypothetical protein
MKMHTRSIVSGIYPMLYARLFTRRLEIDVRQHCGAASSFGRENVLQHARPLLSCIKKATSGHRAFLSGWLPVNE